MKRSPIIRKTPLKSHGYLNRAAFKKVRTRFRRETRARLRSRSPSKRADDAKYAEAKAAHFAEFPRCQHPDGCTRSLLRGDALDLHHKAGRRGPLLYCRRYFATACREHHNLAKDDPKRSREIGWVIDVSSEEVQRLKREEILNPQ